MKYKKKDIKDKEPIFRIVYNPSCERFELHKKGFFSWKSIYSYSCNHRGLEEGAIIDALEKEIEKIKEKDARSKMRLELVKEYY